MSDAPLDSALDFGEDPALDPALNFAPDSASASPAWSEDEDGISATTEPLER